MRINSKLKTQRSKVQVNNINMAQDTKLEKNTQDKKATNMDADGKSLGRLAVEVSLLLRGKGKADFVPYKDMGDTVVVKNVDKMKVTGNKYREK